ncbi:MAG: M20 family metallopeptidase [Spirochaetales bacterium]|nr:M20 family metallopeptidase [Spirochaetales bacterium]
MASDGRFPKVEELLSSMVSYNTVNSEISKREKPEEKLVDFLRDLAERSGFETKRLAVPHQSDELLITYCQGEHLPWVLFDSHLDTVSVEGMTVEPFAALEKGGRIWGRGACDTKGSGAAMFRALWEYAREGRLQDGSSAPNNIALFYSVDEEWGMTGIRAFVQDHYPGLGFKLKGALVGEPTRLRAVIAHNGVVRYTVQTHGVACHSSNPTLGKSAVSDMARLITFLEEEFIPTCNRSHPLTGKAQCSINTIRGGTAANIIPDSCEIQIDRRTVPGESTKESVDAFTKAIDEFKRQRPESEITWQLSIDVPPLDDSQSGAFSAAVAKVLTGMGLNGETIGVTYGTHAADLQVGGIPAVVIGPGDIGQAHTKDEWIDLSELKKAVEVYKRLMTGL